MTGDVCSLHRLTREQQNLVDLFARYDGNLKGIAYAGAGKTSTARAMGHEAQRRGRSGVFLAFNKDVAENAAKSFPAAVKCKTSHSFAFGYCMGLGFALERLGKNIPQEFLSGDRETRAIVRKTLSNFYASASDSIKRGHVPNPLDYYTDVPPDAERIRTHAVSEAARLWEAQNDITGKMPLGHDAYLKAWSLRVRRIRADFVIVDEAQDSNPALVAALERCGTKVVMIGDQYQAIYAWRGAIDAMTRFDGEVARLTQTFRFGPEIAREANRCLAIMGESVPLIGNPAIRSEVVASGQAADAVLVRTNVGAFDTAMLMMDQGTPCHIAGGKSSLGEIRAHVLDAQRLQSEQPARSDELSDFSEWDEVKEFSKTKAGEELRKLVRIVGKYGCGDLLAMIDRLGAQPARGSVAISTVHKAKGLEWDSVRIGDDFREERLSDTDRKLFYVAITRAKRRLIISPALLDAYQTAPSDEEE